MQMINALVKTLYKINLFRTDLSTLSSWKF